MTIRVVLVDDHTLLLDALRKVLGDEPDLELVGKAEDGHAAIERVRETEPDVVVMDLLLPGLNGIDAMRRMIGERPGLKVLALSVNSGRRWVLGALEAGASGYVLKSDSYTELRDAVRAVHAGERYFSTAVTGAVVDAHLGSSEDRRSPFTRLSPREREVLQLVADGCSTREIAERLHRSPHTIDTHRRNLMRKLGLGTVAELTRYAIREGLTTGEA